MAKTTKVLNEEIKGRFLEGVAEHLTNCGEEVLRVGSNEIALPVVDEDGNEKHIKRADNMNVAFFDAGKKMEEGFEYENVLFINYLVESCISEQE